MRVSYWVAKRLDEDETIRGKTRQSVEERLKERGDVRYEQPKRVITPEFAGSYDMLEQCLNGGGPWWENDAVPEEEAPILAGEESTES